MKNTHERVGERPASAREQLLQLREPATERALQKGIKEWRTSPEKAVDRLYGEPMIQKLKGFRAQALHAVDHAYGQISEKLKESEHIERICEILMAEEPTFGERPDPSEHPYLRYEEARPEKTDPDEPDPDRLPRYRINDQAVLADIEYLAALKKGLPASSPDHASLTTLINQLNAYRLLDPSIAMREEDFKTNGGERSAMDIGAKKMGRVALTGILAAGTAIFGTISIVQFYRSGGKSLSLAPFLWAFATIFVANPDLMKSFFRKNDPILQDCEEFKLVTGDRTMQYVCDTYKIEGSRWANVVEHIYDGDHENLHTHAHPTDDAMQRVAKSLADSDPTVEQSLLTMMNKRDTQGNTDFKTFVTTLLQVQRDDAQDFVRTYIEKGGFQEGIRRDPGAVAAIRAIERERSKQR